MEAIVGSVIGISGGLVGCYFSIKNTNGPRERSFMIKSSIVCFAGVAIFLIALFALPHPYRWFLWIPYFGLLFMGMYYGNKIQQRIREEEAK
jgi:uncharacterized membrane protein YfcA